jgi:hypothetical protein
VEIYVLDADEAIQDMDEMIVRRFENHGGENADSVWRPTP